MAGGRPTDYRPEHCQGVVDAGTRGKTLTWFAAKVGQSRRTLYQWQDAHPEFMHACGRARALYQAYWEDRLDAAVGDRQQNSNAILTLLQVTCDDFRPPAQRQELHITGNVNVRSLPRAELEKLAAQVIDIEEVKPAQLEPQTGENTPDAST